MPKSVVNFYMDDSGTRHPDHRFGEAAHGRDWFALGGVLVNEMEEDEVRKQLDDFRSCWPQLQDNPLHSVDIRHQSRKFRWLIELSEEGAQALL